MIPTYSTFLKEEYFDQHTLGIPRESMPQIAQADLPAFWEFLKKEGVSYKREVMSVFKLRPSQDQFDPAKIKPLSHEDYAVVSKIPIMVSKDNAVADGHHRYKNVLNHATKHKEHHRVDTWKVNASAVDLIALMKRFPKVFYKGLSEEDGGGGDAGGASSSVDSSIPGSQEADYGVFKGKSKVQKKKKVVDHTNKK